MIEHGQHCACFGPLTAKVDDLQSRLDECEKDLHGGPALTHAFRLERNAIRDERDTLRALLALKTTNLEVVESRLQAYQLALGQIAAFVEQQQQSVKSRDVETPEVDSKSRLKRIAIQRGESGENAVERQETKS